ncbi:uncharacterized protein LOC128277408 [Anopheles cruzii]|uniref:uncharacterized protein LOC128277408 n=1 Tax=Anopheles cruzii TaxID=68878 RepID=UPI0022EC9447|nr:uncharacterized protein LOC128277408 [Anopheles cruzii]
MCSKSTLDALLESKDGEIGEVDFVLQKRRVDEAFEELLGDLETFERLEAHLQEQKQPELWNLLLEPITSRQNYESFQQTLWKLAKSVSQQLPVGPSSLLHCIIGKVRAIGEKSLLRPESPPVRIKHRSEQESLHWVRLIARQEAEIDSLVRKIAEGEQKFAERRQQRRELRVRSDREMDDQLNASQADLVELRVAGDGQIQALERQLGAEPDYSTMPEYLASLEQADQKRKRIAKLMVQLQLWIKKYDKFIGEPMKSLEELEDRVAGLEGWKATVLEPRTDQLRELQHQIENLEAIALEEKIEQMRKLHAVRVLQRAWKHTLDKKRTKKSKKGTKKSRQKKK